MSHPVQLYELNGHGDIPFMSDQFSPKLDKWLRWMEPIHDEILMLVQDEKVFWEVQDIIRENPRIQKPSSFYRYLERSYISHALAGLRRQIKPHKDSISFVGLLKDIAENPAELSLNYYRSRWTADEGRLDETGPALLEAAVGVDLIAEEFSQYADATGTHVCSQMVKTDFAKLKESAEACEEFGDKRIHHRDKKDPKVVPTHPQLRNCIDLLDKTYVKYHSLFYAEAIATGTMAPTPDYDWKAIFREPWLV